MEPDDVPTVAAIERLSFPTPWPMASFLYELSHPQRSYYYVLLKPRIDTGTPSGGGWRRWLRGAVGLPAGSRVIGYLGFRRRSAETHISTIAVHPDWRGKGLGELLLLTALEKGLELGVPVVSLEVRASNQVAQNLYRKYGFRFASVHRGYYRDGEDAWLMKIEVHRYAYRARLARMRRMLETRLRDQETHVGQNNGDRI
jgi:ribosomal-protein-alanine N-acetyltransferase